MLKEQHTLIQADHGFTVFFIAIKPGDPPQMTDTSVIFKKIRETLNKQKYDNNTTTLS